MHEEACKDEIATRLFSKEEDKTGDVVFDEEHETTVDLSYQSSDDGLVDSYFAGISGDEIQQLTSPAMMIFLKALFRTWRGRGIGAGVRRHGNSVLEMT